MNNVDDFLQKSSLKGLRTLIMAMKIMDEEEFNNFKAEVAEAEKDILQRDKILATIFDRYERGLCLLGATAVEDRL